MVIVEGIGEQRRDAGAVRIHDIQAAALDEGDLRAVWRPGWPPLAAGAERELGQATSIGIHQKQMPEATTVPATEDDFCTIGRPSWVHVCSNVTCQVHN